MATQNSEQYSHQDASISLPTKYLRFEIAQCANINPFSTTTAISNTFVAFFDDTTYPKRFKLVV